MAKRRNKAEKKRASVPDGPVRVVPSLAAPEASPAADASTLVVPPLPRAGLVHLGTVAAVCTLLALSTYASRSLLRWQPWEPGEGVPIVRLFLRGAEPESVTAIEPGGPVDREGADVAAPELALDPVLLAAAREDDDEALDVSPEVTPPAQQLASEDAGTPSAPTSDTPLVTASEAAGAPLEIEDEHHAMDAFYRSLARTARGEAVVTRIEHFGDSTIAFDGITQTVRERMQRRFGDAGSGFVLTTRGTLPYGHHHVRAEAEGEWRLLDITHQSLSDGRYGLGGAQARASSGATAFFETPERSAVGQSVTRFQILYQRHDRGGRFDYRVDDGDWVSVDTRLRATGERPDGDGATEDEPPPAPEPEPEPEDDESVEAPATSGRRAEDAVLDVDVTPGAHRLSVRTMGHGEVRLYGVVLENGERGVVYDSLGMVGARAQRMLGFDATHLAAQLAARDPALVVIAFGGNDADDEREQAEFESTFRQVARLVRAARPEASCLLMAPLDQAERDERGAITTLPTIPFIVEGMRAAARREGCAFFDTWTAMGGEGAMGRWFRQEPRLAGGDFRHATPAGYRVIGEMLYRALLSGLRHYDQRSRRP